MSVITKIFIISIFHQQKEIGLKEPKSQEMFLLGVSLCVEGEQFRHVPLLTLTVNKIKQDVLRKCLLHRLCYTCRNYTYSTCSKCRHDGERGISFLSVAGGGIVCSTVKSSELIKNRS